MMYFGLAFEAICQKHVLQIKQALGIAGIQIEVGSWRYIATKGQKGAQIDLLLDRSDHCMNICEIKFSVNEFVVDKEVAEQIDFAVKTFREQTKTKKNNFSNTDYH